MMIFQTLRVLKTTLDDIVYGCPYDRETHDFHAGLDLVRSVNSLSGCETLFGINNRPPVPFQEECYVQLRLYENEDVFRWKPELGHYQGAVSVRGIVSGGVVVVEPAFYKIILAKFAI